MWNLKLRFLRPNKFGYPTLAHKAWLSKFASASTQWSSPLKGWVKFNFDTYITQIAHTSPQLSMTLMAKFSPFALLRNCPTHLG